jgi:hypothetical protein
VIEIVPGKNAYPLWDGIITAGMKRVAAKEPANGEINATHDAVSLERFDRVSRTTRIVATAGGKQR